jgi:hypothetical protein
MESPSVLLMFVLLNDGEFPIDVEGRAWKLVINGKELPESGWIFGNGPAPVGGWDALKPGDSYHFGKSLRISDYFPRHGKYGVSWRGKAFQSSEINVEIGTASQ